MNKTVTPPSTTTDADVLLVPVTRGEALELMEDLPLGHSVSESTRSLYTRLREWLRSPAPLPDAPADLPTVPLQRDGEQDIHYAVPQVVRPAPEQEPVRGAVVRKVDITGISGLGHIAEFCVFSDGATAIRWLGGPPQNQPKFEFYDNPGIEPFMQISGHSGNTEVVWIDPPAPQQ
jgi:hypothetical protein